MVVELLILWDLKTFCYEKYASRPLTWWKLRITSNVDTLINFIITVRYEVSLILSSRTMHSTMIRLKVLSTDEIAFADDWLLHKT